MTLTARLKIAEMDENTYWRIEPGYLNDYTLVRRLMAEMFFVSENQRIARLRTCVINARAVDVEGWMPAEYSDGSATEEQKYRLTVYPTWIEQMREWTDIDDPDEIESQELLDWCETSPLDTEETSELIAALKAAQALDDPPSKAATDALCEAKEALLHHIHAWTEELLTDWEGRNEPMMNYAYLLPRKPAAEEVEALASLPLTVVQLEPQETYALVLTGGGMDLSWEIAEAHIRLGYYPPIARDLPDMSEPLEIRQRTVLMCMEASLRIAERWAQQSRDDLYRLAVKMR
jgi:hypothetical protein